jgi:hypothetical protein
MKLNKKGTQMCKQTEYAFMTIAGLLGMMTALMLCCCTAHGQVDLGGSFTHPADKLSVWVDGVNGSDHNDEPIEPNGFYHNPAWGTPDGHEDYWDYYINDMCKTDDPNYVDHGIEIQPYRADPEDWPAIYICHAYKGSDDDFCILGRGSQVSWRWDAEPSEYITRIGAWSHDSSVFTERIWGGENQRHDISMPPDEQCWHGGTVYVYWNMTWGDFAERWGQDFKPFDFNKNGVVDIDDMCVFIQDLLCWIEPC